jgi:phospholipid/cholesterol/gamma-HCH transport system substrate-binding protein
MSRSDRTSALSVGFVFFVATMILMAGLFWVGRGRGVFSRTVEFYAHLESASGLAAGATVYLSGVAVGKVDSIDLTSDGRIRLTLAVGVNAARHIRTDSRLWLQTEGLLGDFSVRISAGAIGGEPLEVGSEIPVEERSLLDTVAGPEITKDTTLLMRSAVRVLEEIQRGEGTIGKLLRDPDLYDELTRFLATLNTLATRIDGIAVEADRLIAAIQSDKTLVGKVLFTDQYESRFAATFEEIQSAATDLKSIVEAVRRAEGTVGKLIADATLYDRANSAITNLDRLAARADGVLESAESGGSVLGRLLTDGKLGGEVDRLVSSLDRSVASLERILASVEEGEGSFGVLLRDPSIATGLRNIVLGVQDLGYVRNLMSNAERLGMDIVRRRELTARALSESERIARTVRGTAESELGSPVPSTGSEPVEEKDAKRVDDKRSE